MAESSKALMQVNIVAADHPVWHGTAKSVTIPASEGEMGILADHEPVLTVIDHQELLPHTPLLVQCEVLINYLNESLFCLF